MACVKRFVPVLLFVLIAAVSIWYGRNVLAKNPDPNHAHADFAVWIDGKKLNFSDAKYMSGSSSDEHGDVHEHTHLHPYLHLHDGNGHVIHRHKPGLAFDDFFFSLGIGSCWGSEFSFGRDGKTVNVGIKLFVNGIEQPEGIGCNYVFEDGDHLLITNATDKAEVQHELSLMTDDACLYSQTCPRRGKPPTENCIADPAVPCRE